MFSLYVITLKWKSLTPLFFFLLLSTIFSLTISGTVKDDKGIPLTNVNIYSKTKGTISDQDGKFKIKVQDNSIIIFSHIGYQEIQLKGTDVLDTIIMKKINLLGKNIYVNSSLNKNDLYNTPSSVTFFHSKELSIKSDIHFDDLIGQITNLNFAGGTSRPRYFQIRGIGERSHYAGEGPPNYSVGFLMDGIDFSGIGMIGHLFDVKQIEIFKGPQSTVFGPNAMAGSINILTNNPTPFYTGKIESNYSSDNMITHSGAVGGPLLNSLSFRLVAIKHLQDGFRKNIFLGKENTNGKNELFTRMKLKWRPMNDFTVLFTNLNIEMNNNYDAWAPDNNENLITYSNNQGEDSQKTNANILNINFPQFFGLNSEYVYSHSQSDLIHSYDGDWGNDSLWFHHYGFDPDIEGWNYDFFDKTNRNKEITTNQIRLNSGENITLPLNGKFILGFYSSKTEQSDNAEGWLFGGDATSLHSNFKINNYATYVHYNSKITESLELNLNVRYEHYSIAYTGNSENWGEEAVVKKWKKDDFLGMNFSAKRQINESLLIYTSLAKGYKAGGINQHPYLNSNSRFYDPEYNTNLEIGGRLLWRNTKMNFAIFNMKRTDLQVQISSQQIENDPNSFTYYTSNASSGYNNGFELETTIDISPHLNLKYSFGYLKTYVDKFSYPIGYNDEENPIVEISGNREQAMAPSFNSSFNTHYKHSSGLFLNITITSKDAYYFSDSHNQISNPYSMLNMDVGYAMNGFRISLWGKNITDERFAVRGFYFGLEPPAYEDKLYLSYGDPKEVGIKLSYQF